MNHALQIAVAAHLARPLRITEFARVDLGMDLFPRQAAFLDALFQPPQRATDAIFRPAYREGVALWGKGSGKDTVSAVAQTYVAYRLSLLEDPQAWLGLSHVAPNIDLINVAQNAKQARDVFFSYLRAMVRGSTWFSKLLPSYRDWDPDKDILAQVIRFPNNVYAHSLHSQGKAAEGYNTFFAVMDEADAFREGEEEGAAENADEVHETLLTTMSSRFPRQHLLVILSWPRHEESFTIQRFAAAGIPAQRVYGDRGATWEIRMDRTRADFAADYDKDPEGAAAKYECSPPATVNAFFSLREKLDACFTGTPRVVWEPTTTAYGGQPYRTVRLVEILPPVDAGYWIHGDAGLTGDSYGLAVVRAQGPTRYVDALVEWRPARGEPVYFPDVERVVQELRAAGYRIQGVTFDRWNSAEAIQRLNTLGIYAEALTFTAPQQLEMYQHLKTLAYNGHVVFPSTGPAVERLRRELGRLQLLRGVKIDHPKGESKDLADSVAAACWRVYEDVHVQLGRDAVASSTVPAAVEAVGGGLFNDGLLRPPW